MPLRRRSLRRSRAQAIGRDDPPHPALWGAADFLWELHLQAHHVAALDAVLEDRLRVVAAEVVAVDARAAEPAPFVERQLPQAGVARADLQAPQPRPARRPGGVGDERRGYPLPLVGGGDGEVDDLGREGARVQQDVFAQRLVAAAGDVADPAMDIVVDRGVVFVGQEQQVARGCRGGGGGRGSSVLVGGRGGGGVGRGRGGRVVCCRMRVACCVLRVRTARCRPAEVVVRYAISEAMPSAPAAMAP